MFTVTITTDDDEFTLDVTDIRFVNKWGPALGEEIWLFTNDAPDPFTKQIQHFNSGDHPVYVARASDVESVIVE